MPALVQQVYAVIDHPTDFFHAHFGRDGLCLECKRRCVDYGENWQSGAGRGYGMPVEVTGHRDVQGGVYGMPVEVTGHPDVQGGVETRGRDEQKAHAGAPLGAVTVQFRVYDDERQDHLVQC